MRRLVNPRLRAQEQFINTTMIKKLKSENTKVIVGQFVENKRYFITENGEVFSALKPTIVQGRESYNVNLNSTLRRFSKKRLLNELKSK